MESGIKVRFVVLLVLFSCEGDSEVLLNKKLVQPNIKIETVRWINVLKSSFEFPEQDTFKTRIFSLFWTSALTELRFILRETELF